MTYAFFVYQISNEQKHILNNTITKAKVTTEQAEELILWTYDQREKLKQQNKNLEVNSDFSLRALIYNMAKKEGSTIKIETSYLEDDFVGIDHSVKKVIIDVQTLKKDSFTTYEYKDRSYLFYMNPLIADASCIKCHVHEDDKVGDVIGSVHINIKIDTLAEYNAYTFYFLLFTYFSTWIGGLALIWWMRYKSKQYFDERTRNYEESIYSLIDIMERRDSYTAGHSKRVAEYASLIAQELKLSDDEISLIFRAGMLHDIGKIEVPDALLLKPEKLTNNEYDLIKTHSKVGYEILSREPFYDIASIVLHHHERYDGQGYPHGLKGDSIPTLSQIISIADVYDALTTNRAYRKAMTKKEALEIIEEGKGTFFNPEYVDIAIKIFKKLEEVDNVTALPKSMIEEVRYSYYFRDNLTGFYNSNYLKFLLTHKENYQTICAYHLNFIDFTSYNRKYGWKQGDKFLQEIANTIISKYKDCIVIRIFGDRFLIVNLDKHIKFDEYIFNNLLKASNLKIELSHIDLLDEGIDSFEKLEDKIMRA